MAIALALAAAVGYGVGDFLGGIVPGVEITWGETHVGTRSIFEAAGFEQVAHPTLRRVVMRIDVESPTIKPPRTEERPP